MVIYQNFASNVAKADVIGIKLGKGMRNVQNSYRDEQDRVFSLDEFKQFDQLNQNTNSRIPIFFCVDVSGSMNTKVGFFETRLSLLAKVMRRLLENMKKHPVLSERAVIGVITYNNRAILQQSALDLGILNVKNATSFDAADQTIFSLGLRRTLQAIDQYRDSIRRSDVETFTPMLVFMTDGQPVGDSDYEIESVYKEIWHRVQMNDLYVFPIGISQQANMSYVYTLNPEHRGYQMINENDFESVFAEIETLVNETAPTPYEEGLEITEKASIQASTIDTGAGTAFDISDFDSIIAKHLSDTTIRGIL